MSKLIEDMARAIYRVAYKYNTMPPYDVHPSNRLQGHENAEDYARAALAVVLASLQGVIKKADGSDEPSERYDGTTPDYWQGRADAARIITQWTKEQNEKATEKNQNT